MPISASTVGKSKDLASLGVQFHGFTVSQRRQVLSGLPQLFLDPFLSVTGLVFEFVIWTLREHLNCLKGYSQLGSQLLLAPREEHTLSCRFYWFQVRFSSQAGSHHRLWHRLIQRTSKIADALGPTPGNSDSLGWGWQGYSAFLKTTPDHLIVQRG